MAAPLLLSFQDLPQGQGLVHQQAPCLQDGTFLFGEEFVKEAYYSDEEKATELVKQKASLGGIIKDTDKLQYLSVDDRIVLKLQTEGKLFKKENEEFKKLKIKEMKLCMKVK